MLVVTEHRVDGVSGRAYREFQGARYWFWPKRNFYVSQVGGVQRLLHIEVYTAIHGKPERNWRCGPADGDYCNVTPDNWIQFRHEKSRKHPVQEFEGVRFYWKREGYYKASPGTHGGITMHRFVWAHYNGAIPSGHHIHHIDGDKSNNSIENLELLSQSDHARLHSIDNKWIGSRENKDQIAAAGELAKEWHASEDGRKWHSDHAISAWKNRKWSAVNCQQCGKEFDTPYPTRAKFCHQNCKASALRARRKDPGI